MSQPDTEPAAEAAPEPATMRWYNYLFYGLGAFFLGALLAAIPAGIAFGISMSFTDEGSAVPNIVFGIVWVIVAIWSIPFFWREMRNDFRYVRSPEYAARNPR